MYRAQIEITLARSSHSERNAIEFLAAQLRNIADDLETIARLSFIPDYPISRNSFEDNTLTTTELRAYKVEDGE